MKKTEMMERYEAETGEMLDIEHLSTDANGSWYGYIEELEAELRGLKMLNKWSKEEIIQYQAKAEAYDRIMSGGRKTLKEFANIFQRPVAVTGIDSAFWFEKTPKLVLDGDDYFYDGKGSFGQIPFDLIEVNGDWKDSLTLPDKLEDRI